MSASAWTRRSSAGIGGTGRTSPTYARVSVFSRSRSAPEEPVALREPVRPMLLGYFMARPMLARAGLHQRQFGHSRPRPTVRRIPRVVPLNEFLHQIGALEDDAAASGFCGSLTKVADERGVVQHDGEGPWIIDGLGCKLNDRARLDIAPGID